jgi:hypothetical protein
MSHESTSHPIFRPGIYPFYRSEARALLKGLPERFPRSQETRRLYHSCAEDLPQLDLGLPPDALWQEALENLARRGYLEQLCDVIDAEPNIGRLSAVIAAVRAAQPSASRS